MRCGIKDLFASILSGGILILRDVILRIAYFDNIELNTLFYQVVFNAANVGFMCK